MTIIRIGCDFEPFASLQSFGSVCTMENVFIERKGISKKGKKSVLYSLEKINSAHNYGCFQFK